MKKSLVATLAAALLLSLSACGGGGSDTNSSNDGSNNNQGGSDSNGGGTADQGNQGSASAPFVAGANSRYLLLSSLATSFGVLASPQQSSTDGAVTAVGGYQLSNPVVQGIAGDASFAIGRWVKGSVASSSGTATITNDKTSYHYLAYQAFSSFPSPNTQNCTVSNFTTPSNIAGPATAAALGTSVTGTSVTLTVSSATAATLTGSITVNANNETASLSLPTNSLAPASMGNSGQILSSGAGTLVQVADVGNGSYGLAVMFRANMPSGASYVGVARLTCS